MKPSQPVVIVDLKLENRQAPLSRGGRSLTMLRMRVIYSCLLLLFIVFTLLPATVRAQDQGGSELNLFMGNMLPNQIDGVSEILPIFGTRFALAMGPGYVEIGGMNTHAYGVDFTTFETSFRADVPIDDGVVATAYGGLDLNWYIPEGETSRRSETGVHFGAGGKLLVSDTLWLRADMKFMGPPGTSLYLLFGLTFKSGAGN